MKTTLIASAVLLSLSVPAFADGDPAVHTMIAAIESANTGSIRLHERFGFVVVGQMAQVGRKFDRWLDLTVMQRMCT